MNLGKYSVGLGDRFTHQAKAQLQACVQALAAGIEVIPVWNKSSREHMIIGSEPWSVRQGADAAVRALGWELPYFCDADHITEATVGRFLDSCDFYTIDVAEFIGQVGPAADIDTFVKRHPELVGSIQLTELEHYEITRENLIHTAQRYLTAVKKAGGVYRTILAAKGEGNFISEVSMDETEAVGDSVQFQREFCLDLAIISNAVRRYGLPENLKLSVHSGSDKFSIYPAIYSSIKRFNAGVHLKTAGTTWLEELIGLAETGGDGLTLAKEIYAQAFAHREELCRPYATVIDIDPAKLPSPHEVRDWTSLQYTSALRHVRGAVAYNSNMRQLLHVGFKIAASMGAQYLDLLEANELVIAKNVTENLYSRHLAPVFLGCDG